MKSSSTSKSREKLAVTFDIDARREYLLGFSKRKRERQLEALRQIEQRAREEKKDAREEFRKRLKAQQLLDQQQQQPDIATSYDDVATKNVQQIIKNGGNTPPATTTTTTYRDEFTQHAFGEATVVVTTSTELLHESIKRNANIDLTSSQAHSVLVPKHTKFKLTKNEKIAAKLRDKLNGKKTKRRFSHSSEGSSNKKKKTKR
jgi:hypothetical protein